MHITCVCVCVCVCNIEKRYMHFKGPVLNVFLWGMWGGYKSIVSSESLDNLFTNKH